MIVERVTYEDPAYEVRYQAILRAYRRWKNIIFWSTLANLGGVLSLMRSYPIGVWAPTVGMVVITGAAIQSFSFYVKDVRTILLNAEYVNSRMDEDIRRLMHLAEVRRSI